MSTIERARGRWTEILPQLGIDSRFLRNKHGPCPLCGGKDRFRFDDRDGTGSYICGQCGAGVGIILVRKKHGWDHKRACDEIDMIIGTDAPALPAPRREDDSEKRQGLIERTIAEAREPGIVRRYLAGRGLSEVPPVLLGHPALWHVEARCRLPAVIAPIHGPDGALQSAQRIYLGDVDPRKKTLPAVKTIKGGAVRLFDPSEAALAVAEGVETAIAGLQLFGLPTWAALSAGGVEAFVPPPGLRRLVILADNDHRFAGQRAAYALASRIAKTIAEIEVMVPPEPGTDWLDHLNERNAGRAAS